MEKGLLRKIILGGLFAAVLLVCGMPVGKIEELSVVQAEDYHNLNPKDGGDCGKTEQDNVKWAVYDTDGDGMVDTLVISGQGAMKFDDEWKTNYQDVPMNLVIEEGITRIGEYSFNDMENLIGDLILPESVKAIESGTFCDCSGLNGQLTIPADIEEIGSFAFSGCSNLKGKVVLPRNATEIPQGIYGNCSSLTGFLEIPKGVVEIGDFAFQYCSGLTGELSLPAGLKKIGINAFGGCKKLTGTLTIPQSIESIEDLAFSNCTGFTGELLVPEGTEEIEDRVFSGCTGFTSLQLPKGLKSIGYQTFFGCSGFSGELVLPGSLTQIGERAFSGCSGFSGELVLPGSLTQIENWVFSDCSGFNGGLLLPESLESVGRYAFSGCRNFSGALVFPSGVKRIAEGAFSHSGFTALQLPESLESIGDSAFSYCSTLGGELVIPSGVKTIGDKVFYHCGFTSLQLPKGLESIGQSAFSNGGFQSDIVLPEGVVAIDQEAFRNCAGMKGKAFIVPYSVKTIGNNIFYDTNVTVYDLSGRVSADDLPKQGTLYTVTKSTKGGEEDRVFLPEGIHDELTAYHQFPFDGYDDTENIIWYSDTGYKNRITAPVTVKADMTVYGREKAEQTGFAITEITGLMYGEKVFTLTATGGQTAGEVTFSVPEDNGVITLDGNQATVIGAGTVTVTAKKAGDAEYKPIVATREITVSPKPINDSMVAEIEVQKYTGNPVNPEVTVRDGDNLLVRSRDYTVQYMNNTAQGDKTSANPPTAVIKGIGNYTGEVSKRFTIIKPAAEVTIEEGKEQIAKTYGDDSFFLEGITKTGDGDLTFTVKEGAEVIAVSAQGEVSIKKAGEAVIAVSTKETVNYSPAEEKIITVTVDKALKAPYMPLKEIYAGPGCEKVADVALMPGWEWDAGDGETPLVTDEAITAVAVYTGADKGNYQMETAEVRIIRTACEHVTGEVSISADCECDREPACEKPGFGHRECVKCHHIVEVYIEIEPLGHTGGMASCTSKAVCDRCGKAYGEIDSTKHGGTIVKNAKAATCTGDGYSGDEYCADCDKKTAEGVIIKAKGHQWDEGRITKKPVANGKGQITYTCKVCRQTRTEEAAVEGTVITDGGSKAVYQIVHIDSTGSSGTVQYVRPSNKGAKTVDIPQTVMVDGKTYQITAIAPGAFKNMKKLTRVKVGNNVKTINANAFSGCKALTTVTLGKNVRVIGNKAFYRCIKLKKIVFPAKVEKIGKQAFYGCKSLKSITVKTKKLTAKKVGSKAFKGTPSKAVVSVPKSKKKAYRKLLRSRGLSAKARVK